MRNLIAGLLVLLWGALVSALNAHAAGNTWTQLGPSGGDVTQILVDPLVPTTLYADSFLPGQLKSMDGGVTWANLSNEPYITSLVAIGNTYFGVDRASADSQVYTSTDGGLSWTGITSSGLPSGGVSQLIIIGTALYALGTFEPDHIYESTDGAVTWTDTHHAAGLLAAVGSQLYGLNPGVSISADGGSTWTQSSDLGLGSNIYIYALTGDSNILYLSTNVGIFTSIDGGDHWVSSNNGLPSGVASYSVMLSGSTVYVGLYGGGVYKSTDNGSSWAPCNTGLTNTYVNSLAGSGDSLYAGTYGDGVFVSADGGSTWRAYNKGLISATINALTVSGGKLFAAVAERGTFVSPDGGNTWNLNPEVAGIMSFLQSGPTLYAGALKSLSISADGGSSWDTHQISTDTSSSNVTAIALMGGTIYVGTDDDGVYKSIDGGNTWAPTDPNGSPFGSQKVYAIAVSDSAFFAGTQVGLFKSLDAGASWSAVTDVPQAVFSLAVSGGALFAGTGGGIYKSLDGGISWGESNTGLPGGADTPEIMALLANDATLYAAAPNGVYSSQDRGATWTEVTGGESPRYVIKLAMDGTTLYAGSADYGVYAITIPSDEAPASTVPSDGGGGIPDPMILVMATGYFCWREIRRRLPAVS